MLKIFFYKKKINFRLFIYKIRKLILKIVCVSNTNFWPSKNKNDDGWTKLGERKAIYPIIGLTSFFLLK
ncbi:unnamed protein product [Meloidogyne enterolobii]|uniref:Uncharacterized protein n=1 Tax=Meloidogyne enterolobii TaxID=390850 RepID=A0ACB1AGP0_MELEN